MGVQRGDQGTEAWSLPERRASHVHVPPELAERRAAVTKAQAEAGPDHHLEELDLGSVPCVVGSVDQPSATILWFHGGGFRLGSARGSASFGLRLARASAGRVVPVDYALAPEHPFPAALHDAAAAYDATIARWPGPLLVGGDSAGGGLAVALVAASVQAGRPGPAGLVLLSPWVDLTVTSDSYRSQADRDTLFSPASARDAANLYLQGWPAEDPLASPLLGDLSGLPPTALFASTEEVLLDDARRLAHQLSEAGVEVLLHLVPDVPHVWPTLLPDHPSSRQALEEIGHFVGACRSRSVVPSGHDR